jgi:hypothetical protein
MSQPPNPPQDVGTGWAATPPVWQPAPAPFAPGAPPSGAPVPRKDTLLLTLAALAGLLVGIVGTGLVATALFAGSVDHIGRVITDEVRTAVEEGITDGMAESMEEDILAEEYSASGPVEEFPPTAPRDLGPDPVLNAYAQGCFTGDLQSCDDLYNTSPPLSDYEEYAATCAGRVKPYIVMSCTQLE